MLVREAFDCFVVEMGVDNEATATTPVVVVGALPASPATIGISIGNAKVPNQGASKDNQPGVTAKEFRVFNKSMHK